MGAPNVTILSAATTADFPSSQIAPIPTVKCLVLLGEGKVDGAIVHARPPTWQVPVGADTEGVTVCL